jgi:tetratricopeptide (TPR) repeat protein
VRSMTPAELVERLDQRFRLLTGGSRTALERHQTLRGAVDWSYALLGDAERTVLDRLAVFAGGFRLDAAEAAATGGAVDALDVLDLLSQLVDKSLLIADDEAGLTRYRLLETIRQYAQERLEQTGDADAVRRRHAEHYVAFVEAASPHLRGRDQAAGIERVEAEIDNLRAVMTWSAGTGEADLALRLVVATNVNAVRTSYTAHAWAEAAVVIPEAATHPLLPDALGWAAWGAVFRNDLDRGRELVIAMHDAERRLDSPERPGRCQAPATLALLSGQHEEAAEHAQRWVALARAADDEEQIVQSLTMLATVQSWRGEFDVALPTSRAAVEGARKLGAPGLLSFALAVLGSILHQRDRAGDPERALAMLDEAVQVATLVGNQQAMGLVLFQTAMIRRQQGEHDAALRAALDAAEGANHIGTPGPAAVALLTAACILSDLGEHEPAVTLVGYADRVHAIPWIGELGAGRAAARGAATETLGNERVTDLERRGAALDDTAAIKLGRQAAQHALESSRRSAPR